MGGVKFMLRYLLSLVFVGFLVLARPADAHAVRLEARVDLSSQTMTVVHRGVVKYRWKVSTARRGKVTPVGTWRAKWLSRHHRSSRYNNAPMPYSIFYNGNYAIHGTNAVKRLGRPASAGCIRLHPSNAAILFRLTQREGLKNMRVVVRR
jgi:lipoprotein-anchoring transpeptidase ErfK/SrfK